MSLQSERNAHKKMSSLLRSKDLKRWCTHTHTHIKCAHTKQTAKLEGRWPLPSGATLPSTAPVGNDSLSIASRALSRHCSAMGRGSPVRVQSFLGLDPKCRFVVSRKDCAMVKERQWSELRLAVESPNWYPKP